MMSDSYTVFHLYWKDGDKEWPIRLLDCPFSLSMSTVNVRYLTVDYFSALKDYLHYVA